MRQMSSSDFSYYLNILGERVANNGYYYDIVIFGGLSLIKYYNGRRSLTHDVDFAFCDFAIDDDENELIREADKMIDEFGLYPDWINCDGGCFLTSQIRGSLIFAESFGGGITAYIPSAEAMLAMKVFASRDTYDNRDYIDIADLISYTGYSSDPQDLWELATYYFPDDMRNRTEIDFLQFQQKMTATY